VKIAIQQVSLAQVDQLSIGPVTIGQLTLSNVNLGFSAGQAELTNVSVELKLQLTLVRSDWRY
jgi:hypothetical protein